MAASGMVFFFFAGNEWQRNQFQYQALRTGQNLGCFYLQDHASADLIYRYRIMPMLSG
jgi:hypothetical protein